MLLTLTSRKSDATELGFLLHKHPANVHQTRLPFGLATVFFSKATPEETTAHLLVRYRRASSIRRLRTSPARPSMRLRGSGARVGAGRPATVIPGRSFAFCRQFV